MNIPQQRQYDRFKRQIAFLEQHAEEFAPGAKALAFRDELQGVVAKLGQEANAQKAGGEGTSTPASRKLATLNELREELYAIERTATVIATFNPKFKNSFVLPDRRRKDKLVATAKAFLKSAKPLMARFEEFEMSGDFLERLQSRIEAYEAAQSGKAAEGAEKDQKAGGGDVVSELVAEGEKLSGFLDVVMGNKYRGENEKLEAWKAASEVEKGTRKKKGEK